MNKTLYHNKWISLREDDGYVYSHETRCQGFIVAVLLYDSSKPGMIYARKETNPAWGYGRRLTTVTGGSEPGKLFKQQAADEILEEAGITVQLEELQELGTIRPSKSSDTHIYLYACDIRGKIINKPSGDGSELEQQAHMEWVDKKELLIKCNCSTTLALLARFDLWKYYDLQR